MLLNIDYHDVDIDLDVLRNVGTGQINSLHGGGRVILILKLWGGDGGGDDLINCLSKRVIYGRYGILEKYGCESLNGNRVLLRSALPGTHVSLTRIGIDTSVVSVTSCDREQRASVR